MQERSNEFELHYHRTSVYTLRYHFKIPFDYRNQVSAWGVDRHGQARDGITAPKFGWSVWTAGWSNGNQAWPCSHADRRFAKALNLISYERLKGDFSPHAVNAPPRGQAEALWGPFMAAKLFCGHSKWTLERTDYWLSSASEARPSEEQRGRQKARAITEQSKRLG